MGENDIKEEDLTPSEYKIVYSTKYFLENYLNTELRFLDITKPVRPIKNKIISIKENYANDARGT